MINTNPTPLKKLAYIVKLLLKKNKALFLALLLLNIFTAILAPMIPQIIGLMADALKSGTANTDGIFAFAKTPLAVTILFVICSSCKIVASFAGAVTDRAFQNRLTCQLKSALHDRLLTLDAAYHQQHDQGENLFNVNNVNGVVNAVTMCTVLPVSCTIGLCVTINYLYNHLASVQGIPQWLIWCIIPALLIQPFAGRCLGKKINKAFSKLRAVNIEANAELLNSMKSPLEVQVMAAEKQRSSAFLSVLKKVAKTSNRANIFAALDNQFSAICILIFQSIIALVIVICYSANDQGNAQIAGALIACILLIPQVFDQIGAFIATYMQYKQVEPEVDALSNILLARSQVVEKSHADTLELTAPCDITFKNLTFGYNGQAVLQDLSLVFPAGKTVAVVSHSGGGKSTLLHLLSRLYDPARGSIEINNKDIREYTLASLRKSIARISQFPLFIQGSLQDNFRLQAPEANNAQIESICREVGIWETLQAQNNTSDVEAMTLPLGAENLSGGQRRLLGIARAMLRKPPIVLLDEPTTGVDAQTVQEKICPLLEQFKKHSSIILVDHNMNLVRQVADMVLVLEDGKVADFGATGEVWSNEKSLFRRLWEEYNKNNQ